MKGNGLKTCIFAAAIIIISLLIGSFKLDPNIENSWTDYSYGNKEKRLEQMNLPLKYHAVMIFLSNRDGNLVPLEDHEKTWHFDDIGYMLFSQIGASIFGNITLDGLAKFHNALFVISAIALSVELCFYLHSIVAGTIGFLLLTGLRTEFQPHIYSSVSQHSFATVIPIVFIAIVLPLFFLIRNNAAKTSLIFGYVLIAGIVSAMFAMIRWPVGMACFITLLCSVILGRMSLKQKKIHVAGIIISFVLVMYLGVGLIAMDRDRRLGWYEGSPLSYFKLPPKHKPYFSLLAGIGRYPNSLGVMYNDSALDKYLLGKYTGSKYDKMFDEYAKKEYFGYIMHHPLEYLKSLLKGSSELFYAIPAITFQHNNIFGGAPIVTPGIQQKVQEHDRLFSARNLILNLRFDYLDIKPHQWLIYVVGLISFLTYLFLTLKRRRNDDLIFLGLFVFIFLLAIPRALIPTWGQDFVVAFWVVSSICFIFLLDKVKVTIKILNF